MESQGLVTALRRLSILVVVGSFLAALGCTSDEDSAAGLARRVKDLEERMALVDERLADFSDEDGLELSGLNELLLRLASHDAVKRYRAVKELAARGDSVHQELFGVLAREDGETPEERATLRRQREGAAAALATGHSSAALSQLQSFHAQEDSPKVRALLVTALARSGASQAMYPLIEDLHHSSLTVRVAAVRGLGELGELEAVGPLLMLALGEEPQLAPLARGSIVRLQGDPFFALSDSWPDLNSRQREDALVVLSEADVEGVGSFLRQQLDDPSALVSLTAAVLLAERGDDAGRALAQQRLGSDDPVVARKAREALDMLERLEDR